MGLRSQALTDSPAGLAAFMYDYNRGEPERLLTKNDFLDNVTRAGTSRRGSIPTFRSGAARGFTSLR